jgi:hypothetical protein
LQSVGIALKDDIARFACSIIMLEFSWSGHEPRQKEVARMPGKKDVKKEVKKEPKKETPKK